MSRLNICILGCGSVAKLHSQVARTLPRTLRFSYASRSLQKAQSYNKRFKGLGAFGSYDEACASADVDGVFICTPHALHVEHAELAARHGKPMLIEKPITRSIEELDRLSGAVAKAGAMCMVAENYFFKPIIPALRHHIDRGDIGDVIFIELNKTGKIRNTGWRTDAEMMGGGALLEGGVHWVNLLLEIAGTPTQALAAAPTVAYPRAAPHEDNLQILIRFDNGSVGKLLHSWNTFNRVGGLAASKINGTHGNITFESNGLWALVLGRRKRLRVPGLVDIMGYRAMLKSFVECIRSGSEPRMSLAVARRDMELVFAAYRSLETGSFEAVKEPAPTLLANNAYEHGILNDEVKEQR